MPAMKCGYTPGLAYNIAYTHFQEEEYEEAAQLISDIIERGVKEHPELAIGINAR
ncbi:hypothetical protein Pmar_PMAR015687, partial [Perkinsus marinus ATCC 50983]